MNNIKSEFLLQLKDFAKTLPEKISQNDEWTIRGFIDIFKNVHTISSDTKIISKILELHLFPCFIEFAERCGYRIELAEKQNWYPDLSFINNKDNNIKFAVDLKTTYRLEDYPGFRNGFTLGSHGKYFMDRGSSKNIQYPYNQYSGHFCIGIIYTRADIHKDDELKIYSVNDVRKIPPVINKFTFFAEEKWRIASDKHGSGNTANIGSILNIDDLINGNGIFVKAGEKLFDNYWMNYKKLEVLDKKGNNKKLSSFGEYLHFRGLPGELNNPQPIKKKRKT